MTPRHNAFVQKILESPCHRIAMISTKTDYTLTEKNDKMVPEMAGLNHKNFMNLHHFSKNGAS